MGYWAIGLLATCLFGYWEDICIFGGCWDIWEDIWRILGYGEIGMFTYWDVGVLGYWDVGILGGYVATGWILVQAMGRIVGYWEDVWILGYWAIGMLGYLGC